VQSGVIEIARPSNVILRVCDFIDFAKTWHCKHSTYKAKNAEQSKKSQTLSEAKDLCMFLESRTMPTSPQVLRFAQDDRRE